MPLQFNDPRIGAVYEKLKQCGPRGRELADVLNTRNTRVLFAGWVGGGFTLNFVNTILVNPRLQPDYMVTLLGHEACHVQQRYWVDSVEQELRAYLAQCDVAKELGFNLGDIQADFGSLNPDTAKDVQAARARLRTLFVGQQAAIVYAMLPVFQPSGLWASGAALVEIGAVLAAGVWTLVSPLRALFKKKPS